MSIPIQNADLPVMIRPSEALLKDGAFGRADKVLVLLTEIPAALLVLTEIGVLASGVVSRYVLHTPLIWVDEFASLLFVWLIMLGSAIAFRRGSHMRMTAIVDLAGEKWRGVFELVATVAALTWLALMAYPAYEFASEEVLVSMPALDISNAWGAAALPVGIGIILLISIVRLLSNSSVRAVTLAIAACVCIVGSLVALQPVLEDLGNINLLLFFVVGVGLLVFAGVPIVFSFGLATFGYLSLTTSTPTIVAVGRMNEGMSHLILLSVPLFVFLGILIEMTSMAKVMVQFLANLLGHVRGGLSYVLIGAMYLVSGISGSKVADMAAIAPAFAELAQAAGHGFPVGRSGVLGRPGLDFLDQLQARAIGCVVPLKDWRHHKKVPVLQR